MRSDAFAGELEVCAIEEGCPKSVPFQIKIDSYCSTSGKISQVSRQIRADNKDIGLH
jgi:hypothetical protein